MAIKTFSVQEDIYDKFSRFCRENGITISKQIELFMASVIEEDPEVRKGYLERLAWIRKGKFVRVENFADRYGV